MCIYERLQRKMETVVVTLDLELEDDYTLCNKVNYAAIIASLEYIL